MATYLMTPKHGENAILAYMEGFAAADLRDAFRDVEIASRATHAQAPFFHCYTRFAPGEMIDTEANRKRCLEIAQRELKALGMPHQPYAVSFHIDRKTGDMHMHFAVSRITLGKNGRYYAIDPGLYKNKLKNLSRDCERDYGLRELSSDREAGDLARACDRKEFEEARRLGTDVRAIRTAIVQCFEKSDSGKALKAALDEYELTLAIGDRRDCFVVVDIAGGQHALNKKLTGLTLAQTRKRLGDLDRSQLPSVEEAKSLQAKRQAAQTTQERPKHDESLEGQGRDIMPTSAPQRNPQRELKVLGNTDHQAEYTEIATDEPTRGDACDFIKSNDETDLLAPPETPTTGSATETDNTPDVQGLVAEAKLQPKLGIGGAIRQLFKQVVKVLTGHATDAPTPKKSRRRGGEDRHTVALLRKHTIRLFRKTAWQSVEDSREASPTVDSAWWHWNQQSFAAPEQDDRSGCDARTNHPSPTP